MNKKNVLILMTDSQRFDTIAAAGYDHMITPNLDKLAKDGLIYRYAVSSNPQCMPARIDLITGLTGKFHGYNLNSGEPIKDYAIPTIPRVFSENHYRTAGIGKMHFRPEKAHHGFDHVEFMEDIPVCLPNDDYCLWLKKQGQGHIQNVQGVRTFIYNLPQDSLMDEEYHPNTYVATRSIQWLEDNEDNPFFLKCSWTQPHSPLMIPEYYREMYEDKDLPVPFPIQGKDGEVYQDFNGETVEDNREIRKSYYGSITMIDKNVGRIIDWLKEHNKYDDTLIFFISDHGEMLGDSDAWFKDQPYDGSSRIPFIVKYPNSEKTGISDEFVDHLDIFPTCLDVCDLEYKSDKYELLRPSLLVERDRSYHVFAHGTLDGYCKRFITARTKRFKYVYYYANNCEEMYDLDNDPAEIVNLIATEKLDIDMYNYLREKVDEFEKVNFPHDGYDGNKYVFSAKNDKPLSRRQMSKYWCVFHYYRFWIESGKNREEAFVREFYDVLKHQDAKRVLENVKKAYSEIGENAKQDMYGAWNDYCENDEMWQALEKGLEKYS